MQRPAARSPPPLDGLTKARLATAWFPVFEGSWGLDLWELGNPTQKVPLCGKRKIPKYRHLCFLRPEAHGLCASGRLAAAAARPEQTPANMKTEPSPAAFVLIPRLRQIP